MSIIKKLRTSNTGTLVNWRRPAHYHLYLQLLAKTIRGAKSIQTGRTNRAWLSSWRHTDAIDSSFLAQPIAAPLIYYDLYCYWLQERGWAITHQSQHRVLSVAILMAGASNWDISSKGNKLITRMHKLLILCSIYH